MRLLRHIVLALALLLAPALARADSLEDPGRLAAVQQRRFKLDHELFATAALLPLDAFYKGVGPAAGYAFHFSDLWAWEVVRGSWAFGINTALRDQLEKDYQVAPTKFEQVQALLGTAAMFSPLYGKFSVFNRAVIHAEAYGLLGGSVAKLTDTFRPGPQAGLGVRVFLNQTVSFRFEGRYHVLLGSGATTQVADLSSGVALDFGSSD